MKQILLLTFLMSSISMFAQIDLTDNLIFYYQLEDNTDDASPNSANGISEGITFSSGKFDKGAEFNGIASFIQSPAALIDPASNDLTVAAWVNIRSFEDKVSTTEETEDVTKMICQMQDGTGKGRSLIFIDPNGNQMKTFLGGSTVTGNDSIIENEWVHLALVVTPSESKATLYHNGTIIADSITKNPIESCDGEFNFGIHKILSDGSLNLQNRVFDGFMDEICLLNKALTTDEVQSLMTNGAMHGTSSRYTADNQNLVKISSPGNNILKVHINNGFTSGKATLRLYDLTGKLMLKKNINTGENLVNTGLNNGNYILTLDSDIKTFSKQITLKN